jgi:chaperonin cofactor prefoldin
MAEEESKTIVERILNGIQTYGLSTMIVVSLGCWFYFKASPILLDNLSSQTETMKLQSKTLDRLTATQEKQEQTHQLQLEIVRDIRDCVKAKK